VRTVTGAAVRGTIPAAAGTLGRAELRNDLKLSVALAVISTAVCFAGAELAYRAVLNARYRARAAAFTSETWKLLPGNPLIFRLPANHEGRVKMLYADEYVPYRTNADGFRDPPRGRKRAGVPRVLVLGDSYAFGWGVDDAQPFPQRTEALLRERGIAAEVINAGVPGYNTEQEALLLAELMPSYAPDMVVLAYVMNDAEPQNNVPQPPAVTYRYAVSWVWEDAREVAMRRLAGRKEWTSPNKQAMDFDYVKGFAPDSPKWRASRAALGRIAAACRAAGVPLAVLILPDFTQPFDASYPDGLIHRSVAGWSRELGVECVDLMPLFAERDHRNFMILTDGHPNARAHDVIASVLRDRIVADLRLAPAATASRPTSSSGRR
jgi:hypothetical protein